MADMPTLDQIRENVKESLRTLRQDHKRSLNPTPYKVSTSVQNTNKKERNIFFLPQWLGVMDRVVDIQDLCQQMFQFSNKINLSIFRWFAQCPLSVLRLVWGLSRIIHYRVNTAAVNVRKAII